MGVPVRRCIVCRARAPKKSLLRIVARGGVLGTDPSMTAQCRGAYVHATDACLGRLADVRRISAALAPLYGPAAGGGTPGRAGPGRAELTSLAAALAAAAEGRQG